MDNILKLLEHTHTQIKYFRKLQEAAPDRKLNAEIKKLKVRENVLKELV